MISESFWRSRFNADPQVLGRPITLSSRSFTIVGVMPDVFQFPARNVQVWAALPLEPPTRRGPYYLRGIVRLPAGMTIPQAQTELGAMSARIKAALPALPSNYGIISVPLTEWMVGKVRPALLILLAAVGFVLLIASLNVANLMLGRASAREREISIRAALGATRARLLRQFLTENLLLAFVGGIAGLLLSVWGIDLLRAFGPDNVPRLQDVAVDRWVLVWTALISLGSGLLFGIAPAWHGARMDLNSTLKEGGRTAGETAGARRVRGVLVVSEVALALILLVGAGLLIRSFMRLQQVDPGFSPDQIISMRVRFRAPNTRKILRSSPSMSDCYSPSARFPASVPPPSAQVFLPIDSRSAIRLSWKGNRPRTTRTHLSGPFSSRAPVIFGP